MKLLDKWVVETQTRSLIQTVTYWRGEIQKVDPSFGTPDRVNAARFVDTEGSEVTDAFLRLGDWSRNGNRDPNIYDEVGDLLFMLVSTLTPEGDVALAQSVSFAMTAQSNVLSPDPSTDVLTGWANVVFNHVVLHWPTGGIQYPVELAVAQVLQFCFAQELDPVDLVAKRLERIFRKRERRARTLVD